MTGSDGTTIPFPGFRLIISKEKTIIFIEFPLFYKHFTLILQELEDFYNSGSL